jgi:hypothetical protein
LPDVVATVRDDLGLRQVCGRRDPFAWVGAVLSWTEHRVALLAQMLGPEIYDKCLLGATRLPRYSLYNREEFLTHYHKRSNVETAFSMIKAKFGDAVRSKSDIGQLNEVLCKVLCHNLCVIIQAIHELGIEPRFDTKPSSLINPIFYG